MKKKAVLYMLVILVVISLVFATDWTGGGYDYEPSEEGGGASGSSGSGAGIPGEEEKVETEYTLEDFCNTYPVCTSLTMDVGIYCFFDGRSNPNVRRVVNYPMTWYGYTNEDDKYSQNLLGKNTILDFIEDNGLNEPFFGEISAGNLYEWEDYYWVTVPWISNSDDDDVRLYRYEGKGYSGDAQFPAYKGCRAYGGYFFVYNITGDIQAIDQSYVIYDNLVPWVSEGWTPIWSDNADTNIIWDESEFDCTKIGGAWLDDDNYQDEDNNNYQCCGDDYIWTNNRPLTEEESGLDFDNLQDDLDTIEGYELTDDEEKPYAISLAANYCLYSSLEETEVGTPVEINLFDNYYACGETEFDAYDEVLELSDDYSGECYDNGNLLSSCPFLLMPSEEKTDVGKWSAEDLSNPQVCRISSFEKGIPTFAWDNVTDAGDAVGENSYPLDITGNEITELSDEIQRASTICEQYLGGKWTGSHCCGNKYDYDSSMYVDESYSETTPIYYTVGSTILYQYACLQGEIYNSKTTAQYAKDDGTSVELLNSAGMWYGCNADTSLMENDWYTQQLLISTDTNIASCEVLENYLCNYNPTSGIWEWYSLTSGEEGTYVKDTLRYSTGETFILSTPEWSEEGLQPYACCAGYTCWDGTQCVDEYTEYTYEDSTGEEVVSVCYNGDWTGPLETKYDWYYNTDGAAVDYCVDLFACVCSSNEDDSTFCVPEGEYFSAGCTLTQDFYVNDHLCEAIDSDGDGSYDDSSVWTSRTKFLAFQLMQLADGLDYILFCDTYSNTLNNYVDVEAIAGDINSFCILKQDDAVTIGVTFNSEDNEEPMTVDAEEVLFEGSNAFVDILDEDIDDCDAAIGAEQDEDNRFGEYYSCDSSTDKLFYNNKLHALIYSKDGLGTATLPYPDTATYQALFDDYKQQVVDYIDDGDITNPAGNDITAELEAFNYASDFNRIYYNTDGIFGFEEIRYNGESDNRYYMAVVYTSALLDCTQVYAPYETTATVHCNNNIVLERSSIGSAYWTSLTAGLRAE